MSFECVLDKDDLLIKVKCEKNILAICNLKTLFSIDERTHFIYPYETSTLISCLQKKNIELKNNLRQIYKIKLDVKQKIELRKYQQKVLERLRNYSYRGTILMPTGSGKTIIALKVIEELGTHTLIIAPTIALMKQWATSIKSYFSISSELIGLYWRKEKNIKPITIATYNSASKPTFLSKNIDKFGLLVFDEAHHLFNTVFREIPLRMVAKHRIGLTATIDKNKYVDSKLNELIGEIIEGPSLSELELKGFISSISYRALPVSLSNIEKSILKKLKKSARPKGNFIKKLVYLPSEKLNKIEEILRKHRKDRVIIFTRHQESAREIAELFGIPLITSSISLEERSKILRDFARGAISKIVTAEMLDEGIDVPEANVAIIVSGRSSSRQLVQRIGRIIRPRQGKKAYVYELFTKKTYEEKIFRRRQ